MNTELDWLKDRYIQQLNSLYAGEIESLNTLPQLVEVAQGPALKSAFQRHLEKTGAQIGRLHRIFANLSYWPVHIKPRQERTPVRGAGYQPPATGESADSDGVLVSAARQMEHHEISGYLLALNCAEILRDRSAAGLLEKTLFEEYEIDQILAGFSQPDLVSVKSGTSSPQGDDPESVRNSGGARPLPRGI